MTKKELRRLQNLLTVKVDALAAWVLLRTISEYLGQGGRDEFEEKALGYIAQDLYDALKSEGLVCDDGVTKRWGEYVQQVYETPLRVVK